MSEATDATRRTRLANERTYLAWFRTGLAALAVGIGAGKLVPELSPGPQWPFEVVGTGFALLGIAFMVVAVRRQRIVEAALREGRYAPLDDQLALVLTIAGVALGLATIVLVLFVD